MGLAFVLMKHVDGRQLCALSALSALKLVQGFEEGVFVGAEWRRVVVYRLRIGLEVGRVPASLNLGQKRRFDLQHSSNRSLPNRSLSNRSRVQSFNGMKRRQHNASTRKRKRKREQGRGKRKEGRGKRKEGRGKREERRGGGSRDNYRSKRHGVYDIVDAIIAAICTGTGIVNV